MELIKEPSANGAPKVARKLLHLVRANKDQVRDLWPFVRRGCLTVKAKTQADDLTDDSGNWTPEHIRAQLELFFTGRSSCELWLITEEGGAIRGFLVTVISTCPYIQVPISLLVWVAYTARPIGSRNARAILAELEDYAKKSGLLYVDGYTNRPEWASWL